MGWYLGGENDESQPRRRRRRHHHEGVVRRTNPIVVHSGICGAFVVVVVMLRLRPTLTPSLCRPPFPREEEDDERTRPFCDDGQWNGEWDDEE